MDHDDFQPPEPIRGLPEVPPEGEHILWQGSPNWWALANEALMLRWVAVYFAFLAVWRGAAGFSLDYLITGPSDLGRCRRKDSCAKTNRHCHCRSKRARK